MFKTLFKYIFFFIIQGLIFLFIIDFILLPFIANDNEELYLTDVRGMHIDEAVKELDKFEIELFNQRYTKGMIPGHVTTMSPHPFTLVKEGKVIKLTIINNPEIIVIDNYKNKSYRDMQLKLDRKSVEIDTIIYEYSNKIKKGFIIDHYPKENDTLIFNQKLTLVVSQGKHPNYYVVPNVINLSFSNAKERISRSGFLVGDITYEYNEKYLYNTVLEQSHPPNKRLSFPDKINLILSTDKENNK